MMKNTGDIKLTVKRARKVYIFEKLRDGKINNSEIAASLALSVRQVQRIKKAFAADGLSAFLHGNSDRKPANAISEELAAQYGDEIFEMKEMEMPKSVRREEGKEKREKKEAEKAYKPLFPNYNYAPGNCTSNADKIFRCLGPSSVWICP
ncbi:MAG: helix-turn-helix domain-containing protein [Synergistaceae bacterium]|jgi:hypothetical protein|nr:helix-turn-helix domain-containing protein [Synergistaceae bacterium]